jgi:hypothetical protein
MEARTGAAPSPLAIWGLPPDSSTTLEGFLAARTHSPNIRVEQLADQRLSIPQDAIASLLQRLDAHHGLLHGGDGVL